MTDTPTSPELERVAENNHILLIEWLMPAFKASGLGVEAMDKAIANIERQHQQQTIAVLERLRKNSTEVIYVSNLADGAHHTTELATPIAAIDQEINRLKGSDS